MDSHISHPEFNRHAFIFHCSFWRGTIPKPMDGTIRRFCLKTNLISINMFGKQIGLVPPIASLPMIYDIIHYAKMMATSTRAGLLLTHLDFSSFSKSNCQCSIIL
jgi:hypothetical protein